MKYALYVAALSVTLTLSNGLCCASTNIMWSIESSTNLATWQTVASSNDTPATLFFRIRLPNGQVVGYNLAIGATNVSTAVSNNTLIINAAPPSSNDWARINSMSGSNALILNIPRPQ